MSACYDSRVVLDLIDQLRARGAVRATFHEGGELASVDFAPTYDVAPPSAPQHDTHAPVTRPPRATGRLVPRGALPDDSDG